jgi:putative protease
MIEAGVYSMKIEGRMKSPRYTAGVVSIYRKYADLYLEKGRGGYKVEDGDRKILLDLFDRGGQTDGYYKKHNGRDMIVWKEKPSFREGNNQLFDMLDREYVEKQLKVPVTGKILLSEGEKASLVLTSQEHRIVLEGDLVMTALNQPMSEEKVLKQLNKTGNTPFLFENLEAEIKGNVFIPVQALNDLRRKGLEELEAEILREYKREYKKAEYSGEEAGVLKAGMSGPSKLTVSLEKPDCFDSMVHSFSVSRLYIDAAHFEPERWSQYVTACHKKGKECFLTMPHVFRTEAQLFFDRHQNYLKEAGFDGFLIRSMEEPGYLKKTGVKGNLVFDFGMYGMNNQAQKMLKDLGAHEITWPVELNSRELEKLEIPGELLIYGRLPMMVTAQCIHQGVERCDKTPVELNLKDRMGKEFPVRNHCAFCYNSIYNSAPLSLLGLSETVNTLSPASLRLQFTIESPRETENILKAFSDEFLSGKKAETNLPEFTRGHFKRGIE